MSAELLGRIERAEEAVRVLGFPVCRVRSHGTGAVARVEVPSDDVLRAAGLRAELDAEVRAVGFAFCALDLQGFRSGRMNVLLAESATTPGTR